MINENTNENKPPTYEELLQQNLFQIVTNLQGANIQLQTQMQMKDLLIAAQQKEIEELREKINKQNLAVKTKSAIGGE